MKSAISSPVKGISALLLALALPTATLAQTDEAALLASARQVATEVPAKLLDVLNEQVVKEGVAGALNVCRERAPAMAKAASEQTGWGVRRVSLKNRNPKAVPDAWERSVLEDFDRRVAAGETVSKIDAHAVVETDGRKEFRYMKALGVQRICTACHGPADGIKPDVMEQLRTHYPQDLATGYTLGQVRGAITLRKPL